MKQLYGNIYKNKTVLVTGHTGFKGSWLSYWLSEMGAKVIGYSLEPETRPNHISMLDHDLISVIGDIRDQEKLDNTFSQYKPDIVFHLAAQALVRKSYRDPIETYDTNVMGTLKVFEACRKNNIKAIVNITSDKVYENKEWTWAYRENDRIGGFDPYSSSKGCVELLTSSYQNSYFNLSKYKKDHYTLIATCRAGNVIGGGDWAEDRLIVDLIKSSARNEKLLIRSPHAVRPWQHVLDPLSGYLSIGKKLFEEDKSFATSWNFGPSDTKGATVQDVVTKMKTYWDKLDYGISTDSNQPHEANLLRLDSSKAQIKLNWKGVWPYEKALKKTAAWYQSYYEQDHVLTKDDLLSYISDAKSQGLEWAQS